MMAMVAKIRVRGAMGALLPCKQDVGSSSLPGSTRVQRVAAAATALISDNLDADVAQLGEHPVETRRSPVRLGALAPDLPVLARFLVPALRGSRSRVAQLVEPPAHNRVVMGSNPIPGTQIMGSIGMRASASVAQLVEQPPRKRQVAGSMPVAGPAESLTEGTAGTTTTNGSVPERSKGTACRAVCHALNTPGSNPGRPTSLTAGGDYPEGHLGVVNNRMDEPLVMPRLPNYERVAELVQVAGRNPADAGSSPAALSRSKDLGSCCGAMVQWNGSPAVYRGTRVRSPLAPLPRAADSDTCARGRHPFAGGARLVERRVANAEVAGSNPVSRSRSSRSSSIVVV